MKIVDQAHAHTTGQPVVVVNGHDHDIVDAEQNLFMLAVIILPAFFLMTILIGMILTVSYHVVRKKEAEQSVTTA